MRQIMKEYFNDYRRKADDRSYIWIGVAGGLMINSLTGMSKDYSRNEIIMATIQMILLFLPMLSALCALTFHNLHLPKMMNLAPVSDEEKLSILKKKYVMKLVINAGVGLIVSLLMILVFQYKVYTGALLFWEILVLSLLVRPEIDNEREAKYSGAHLGYYVLFFLAYFTWFALFEPDPIDTVFSFVFIIIVTAIQIPVLIRHFMYVNDRIKKEVSYR